MGGDTVQPITARLLLQLFVILVTFEFIELFGALYIKLSGQLGGPFIIEVTGTQKD